MTKNTYAYIPFVKIFPLSCRLGSEPFGTWVLAESLGYGLSRFLELDSQRFRQCKEDYIIFRVESKLLPEIIATPHDVRLKLDFYKRLEELAKKGKVSMQEQRVTKIPFRKKDLVWFFGKPEITDNSHGQCEVLVIHDGNIIIPVYGQLWNSKKEKPNLDCSPQGKEIFDFLNYYNISARLSTCTIRKSDAKLLGCAKVSSQVGQRIMQAIRGKELKYKVERSNV